MTDGTAPAAAKQTSPWAPFQHRAFAVLWCATLVSNIGTWMHDVGAGWLMTELSPSPLVIAAVQAATTLPIFLFALPAGALADLLGKRRLLISINILMGAVAATLAVLVTMNAVTPAILLAITLLMGTGTAFMAPAWQAVVPQLVPRPDLAAAVSLNSVGINISRAIGPALAGFLIVTYGLALPFFVNAISVIGIVAALLWWREPERKASALPPETILQAAVAGVRYAANNAPLKSTLLRSVAFFLFASGFWALLPLIVRNVIGGGATLYGVLLGVIGAGAVFGAVVLPRIKQRLGPDGTVVFGTVGIASAMSAIAVFPVTAVAIPCAAIAGLSWISVLSTLNVSAQTALPDWVRARGLSISLMAFFGSMTFGSLMWGHLASIYGVPHTLLVAAAGAVLAILVTRRAKLNQGAALDLAPSMHWPAPLIDHEVQADRGPVMIQIRYDIRPEDRDRFIAAMHNLASARRRNGGYGWLLLEDAAVPNRFTESWLESSWLQHLRHHERVGGEVKALQDEIATLHAGTSPPAVTHMIGMKPE